MGRVVGLRTLVGIRRNAARRGKKVVFTNGTFDILHRGHAEYLAQARACGDVLMVGLNTDASIRRIKGKGRPVNRQEDRAVVLASLAAVDYVCLFSEDTPLRMIRALHPDVLVKGADWKEEEIVGADIVLAAGGRVRRIRLTPGRSTTSLIQRIRGSRRDRSGNKG
jgi:D-beta-D-heptose 7-phosphate kinase/D-beta-D-heptose 1-phosphate adenosyltransferase